MLQKKLQPRKHSHLLAIVLTAFRFPDIKKPFTGNMRVSSLMLTTQWESQVLNKMELEL